MRRGVSTAPGSRLLGLREPGVPGFEVLVDLGDQISETGRAVLMAIADDLFGSGARILNDQERALMHDVLRRLAADVERSLRRCLADRMADGGRLPRGPIATLAGNDVDVVHPMLIVGGVLRTPGLVEAVKHRTQAHMLATLVRKRIVADSTVDTAAGEIRDVIATLLTRAGATISRGVTEYLIAESRRVDTFQNPLVLRRDLPYDITERLYWQAAAALRQHICDLAPVDREALDDAMEAAVSDALADSASDLDRPTATEALIDGMDRCGELDEGLLVQMLRQGDVSLFESGFARLAGVGSNLIGRLLYEPGGEGLAVACRAAGFARATLATIFGVTRTVSLPHGVFGAASVTRIGRFFDRLPQETAAATLRHWRRNPSYRCAMRRIGGR